MSDKLPSRDTPPQSSEGDAFDKWWAEQNVGPYSNALKLAAWNAWLGRSMLSETAPCKRAGLSLIEDIMDDAKLLKEHAPKELHAMIDGIYYRAQNAKGSFDE